MVRDLENSENVPKPPSPNTTPDLAHHNGNEVLLCPDENGTMFQQFWLFMTNSWPHLILQEPAEI